MTQMIAARSADVVEGKVRPANVGGRPLLLTRVQGKVCAFSPKCPHVGLPLTRGKIENGTIRCPFHGSRFDLATGKNLDWANAFAGLPMPAWTHRLLSFGKQPAPLTMYDATERDGEVVVTVAAE